MNMKRCIYCDKRQCDFYCSKEVDDKVYKIFACMNCKSMHVRPLLTTEALIEHYRSMDTNLIKDLNNKSVSEIYELEIEEENSFPNSTLDADRILKLIKKMASGGNFLDVGAGFGHFSKKAHELGYIVTALEANEIEREVFYQITGFKASPEFLDEGFAEKHIGEFDIILMSQVLEHMTWKQNPVGLIKNMLSNDGVVAIAVPNHRSIFARLLGHRFPHLIPPEHVNFFSSVALDEVFLRNGFEILHSSTSGRIQQIKLLRQNMLISFILKYPCKIIDTLLNYLGLGMFINKIYRKI
jgi:2-polyprenyl-3-methyl-5-hydroxy-6-metoxy-1,4-benzoquinol methylase